MLQPPLRYASVQTVSFPGPPSAPPPGPSSAASSGASLSPAGSAPAPIDTSHELNPDLHQDHLPERLVIAPPPLDPISELAAIERSGRGHRRPKRTRFRAAKSAIAMCVCAGVLSSGAAVFLGRGPISDYLFASTSARTPSAFSAAGPLSSTAAVAAKAIVPQASPTIPIDTRLPSAKATQDSELFLPASMVAIEPSELPKPAAAHPLATHPAVRHSTLSPPSSLRIDQYPNHGTPSGALFAHVPNN